MVNTAELRPAGRPAWGDDPASSASFSGLSYRLCLMVVSCCGRFLEGPAPATRAFLTGQAGRVTLWARPSLKLCTHGVPGGISEAAFPSTGHRQQPCRWHPFTESSLWDWHRSEHSMSALSRKPPDNLC